MACHDVVFLLVFYKCLQLTLYDPSEIIGYDIFREGAFVMTNYFPPEIAVLLTLFSAAMWGSWMQIIKHRKDYPLSGIVFLLYSFSFVMIWGVTLLLAPVLLPGGIAATTYAHMRIIPRIVAGGAMMSLGMLISLHVMQSVGLLLSTAFSGALGSLLGIVTSVLQEGVPEGRYAIVLLVSCTLIFIAASFMCNYSAVLRDRDRARGNSVSDVGGGGDTSGGDGGERNAAGGAPRKQSSPVTAKILLLLLLSTFLVNGWSVGTAAGTATGVPPILTCACMATGSFLSIALVCGVSFTVNKKWTAVLCIGHPKKPLLLSLIGCACHYGGNLISIYAMPAISATLSFLFGRTANIWTYFWGFYYKEFAGAKQRTYAVLTAGIALYFAGILLLGLFRYIN